MLTQTDALGNTTTSEWNFYTMMGNHTPQNLKSTTDALGHKTSYGYTDPGMLRSMFWIFASSSLSSTGKSIVICLA